MKRGGPIKSRGVVIVLAAVVIASAAAYALYQRSRPAASPAQTQPAGTARESPLAETKTAAAHASFASEGTSVNYVREHLGHVILCLEGPRGMNVNAAWDNPCQGQGNAVLNDLGSAGASWSLVAQTADDLAVRALRSGVLAEMKVAASGVAALMKLIAEAP